MVYLINSTFLSNSKILDSINSKSTSFDSYLIFLAFILFLFRIFYIIILFSNIFFKKIIFMSLKSKKKSLFFLRFIYRILTFIIYNNCSIEMIFLNLLVQCLSFRIHNIYLISQRLLNLFYKNHKQKENKDQIYFSKLMKGCLNFKSFRKLISYSIFLMLKFTKKASLFSIIISKANKINFDKYIN